MCESVTTATVETSWSKHDSKPSKDEISTGSCFRGVVHTPRRFEDVKEPPEEENHFTQRRKGLEGAKKTKLVFFACLCAFAPWRELFDFFTPSNPGDAMLRVRAGKRRMGW
jgi:hypothetical protein